MSLKLMIFYILHKMECGQKCFFPTAPVFENLIEKRCKITDMYVWTSSAALCLVLTDPCSTMRVPAVHTASRWRMLGIPCGSDVTRSSTDGVCVSPGDVISYGAVASSYAVHTETRFTQFSNNFDSNKLTN